MKHYSLKKVQYLKVKKTLFVYVGNRVTVVVHWLVRIPSPGNWWEPRAGGKAVQKRTNLGFTRASHSPSPGYICRWRSAYDHVCLWTCETRKLCSLSKHSYLARLSPFNEFHIFVLLIKSLQCCESFLKTKIKRMRKYQNQGSWKRGQLPLGKAIFVEKGHAERRSSYHVISGAMLMIQCPLVVWKE